MTEPHVTLPADFRPFDGGRKLMLAGLVVGVLGTAASIVGFFTSPREALLAWTVSFTYWLFICLGAIALVMANHAAGARWNVVVRRIGEAIAAPVPLFALLALPLLIGAPHIYQWVSPTPALGEKVIEELHEKRAYLNFPFYVVRVVIYFATWTALTWALRSWSLRQDADGAAVWTRKARFLSGPGLVALAFTLSFATFDWMMSLQPLWYSTIFGLYVWAGGFVAMLAIMLLIVTGLRSGTEPLGTLIRADHQHNLAKLLFAFIAFWAYMGFSQYMLIWSGNLPEELPWITVRSFGVWRPVGILIVVGHFAIPFLLLLSRELKRKRGPLAAVCAWMLIMHYIDTYWVVMPSWHTNDFGFHWTHVTSFLGIGGLALAAGFWLARGRYAIPVGDPYLEDSLRYAQP